MANRVDESREPDKGVISIEEAASRRILQNGPIGLRHRTIEATDRSIRVLVIESRQPFTAEAWAKVEEAIKAAAGRNPVAIECALSHDASDVPESETATLHVESHLRFSQKS